MALSDQEILSGLGSMVGVYAGWKVAQKEHFATGGVFDQITTSDVKKP